MAALSDNKYDVFNWIHSVINSIEERKHYPTCRRLIRLFYSQHQDWDLKDILDSHLMYKLQELGSTKKEAKQLLKG
jgi:hypothetical protein